MLEVGGAARDFEPQATLWSALLPEEASTWLLQRTDQRQVYGRLLDPLALEGLQLAGP